MWEALFIPLSILGIILYFIFEHFSYTEERMLKLDRKAFKDGYHDRSMGKEYRPPLSKPLRVYHSYRDGYYKADDEKRNAKEPILTTE